MSNSFSGGSDAAPYTFDVADEIAERDDARETLLFTTYLRNMIEQLIR